MKRQVVHHEDLYHLKIAPRKRKQKQKKNERVSNGM
jgi:hypothetical protein